jgi:iron complex transport system ATP-binding protein
MTPIVRLENLHIHRQGQSILENINLIMNGRDRLAVLGPNGAGKSFLLRVLSADLVPSFGSYVEIFGQVFGQTRLADLRRQIGFVATRQAFWFRSSDTVWEVVASGLDGVYGVSQEFEDEEKKLIDESLDKFGLTQIIKRPFEVLSDGEKRRTLLARGLVHKPRLLILDEPAIGLDIPNRLSLLAEIDRLAKELPIIYVTHNLEELPTCINQVLLLKHGQIFAQGTKEDTLTSSNLSKLLDIKLEVVPQNGKYFVLH